MLDDETKESSTDDTVQQDSPEAHDDETGSETPTIELPEDPEALKVFAQQQAQQVIEERRAKRKAIRDAERSAENEREQRTKADYAAGQLKILESQRAKDAQDRSTKPPDTSKALDEELAGIDLADFIEDKDGVKKLIGTLRDKGVIVTKQDLDAYADQREQRLASKSARYRAVGEKYPDLYKEDSALHVETFAEFDRIKQQEPGISDGLAMELAASRAAEKVNYVRPNGKEKPKDQEAERRKTAQGATGSKGPGSPPAPVKLTEGQIRESMRITGLPREEAMKIAQRSEDKLAKARHQQAQASR